MPTDSSETTSIQTLHDTYEKFYQAKYRRIRSILGHSEIPIEQRNEILKKIKETWKR